MGAGGGSISDDMGACDMVLSAASLVTVNVYSCLR